MLSHSSEASGFYLAHNIYIAIVSNVLYGEFCFDHETGIIAWGRIHGPGIQPFSYQRIFHVFYLTTCSFFSKRLWKMSVVNIMWIRFLVKKRKEKGKQTATKPTNHQTKTKCKFCLGVITQCQFCLKSVFSMFSDSHM